MSEYGTRTTPEENDEPVPRDLPDQQVQEGEDPWDVITPPDFEQDEGSGRGEGSGEDGRDPESGAGSDAEPGAGSGAEAQSDGGGSGAQVPDTDEAGTGRQGESGTSTVHPEDPEPQESPA